VLEQVKAFLVKNGLHLAVVVGLVLVGVLGYKTLKLRRETQTLTQWDAVSSAPETAPMLYGEQNAAGLRQAAIERLRQVVEQGATTTATPWVRLRLASLLAEEERWGEVAETCRRLVAEHPESAAAEPAREMLAAALEQTGAYEEAADLYERLASTGPPRHLVAAGRARELAGDLQGAEGLYRRALEELEEEDLLGLAEGRLADLAQGKPLPPPPEPAAPEPTMLVPGETELIVPEATPTTTEPPAGPAPQDEAQSAPADRPQGD
jgi:tetratricopeptide (TPR) repeat protein